MLVAPAHGIPPGGPTGTHIFVLRWPLVEIHRSASKHGVSDDDVVHAVGHEMVSVGLDPDADPPKVLVIGPDSAGNLLEVIVIILADDRMIAIHAMKLRRHFYELLPGEEGSP
jgi:hypothetical protein